ncbi:MAG: trimeric intracellular cation channel family protein [Firmicutes bacterium]|nr:trimeric intracellular cation channel family protein [Bacillota bacterium]MDD7602784.1 trimeric intracellular cation channel family protein [Bacillota bacterium]MDY5856717.1 trimeric intracellular cation channel family protein [Anaerovoracaceae bacterium]
MSETISFLLEIIGTVAFSVSGAMLGLQKKMDILGITILGLTTAVGGGVIRDLILGIHPPKTFQDPVYAAVAIITALVVCTPWVLRFFARRQHLYDLLMLVMDSVGLGIFTVVGISTAYSRSDSYSLFLLIFVGAMTGVGGGVLRDTMASEPPYIFVKHFYASASILGALLCALMWPVFGESLSMITGTAAVVVLRLLAARLRWSLPKPRMEKYFEGKEE